MIDTGWSYRFLPKTNNILQKQMVTARALHVEPVGRPYF